MGQEAAERTRRRQRRVEQQRGPGQRERHADATLPQAQRRAQRQGPGADDQDLLSRLWGDERGVSEVAGAVGQIRR